MVIRLDGGAARYGLPGLLLGIGVAWVSGIRGPEVVAQTGSSGPAASGNPSARSSEANRAPAPRPTAGGEANGTLALITTAGSAQWLYLIDTKDRAFALYRIDPMNSKGGIVKLEASRQYRWDLKLEHYNNLAPEPDAIKATVETLGRSLK